MTAHSPVGMYPEQYSVTKDTEEIGSFANNDIVHHDPTGADHNLFSEGLKKSLFNYMHGQCFEFDLQEWFDFDVPHTTISPSFISSVLDTAEDRIPKPNNKIIWLGDPPIHTIEDDSITFQLMHKREVYDMELPIGLGKWLLSFLISASPEAPTIRKYGEVTEEYIAADLDYEEDLWQSDLGLTLRAAGLICI